jgi:hypothetical protein
MDILPAAVKRDSTSKQAFGIGDRWVLCVRGIPRVVTPPSRGYLSRREGSTPRRWYAQTLLAAHGPRRAAVLGSMESPQVRSAARFPTEFRARAVLVS